MHHAGIPVALLILVQDYRFVFLDAFVRFLAECHVSVSTQLCGVNLADALKPKNGSAHLTANAPSVTALGGLLILFASPRGTAQRLLTKAIFRRGRMKESILDFSYAAARHPR